MEEDAESEIQTDKDARGQENKRKRSKNGNSSSDSEDSSERKFVVGMKALSSVDGIFNDQHRVAKFIGKLLGEVKSIRIARSGIVVIECLSKMQMTRAIRRDSSSRFDGHRVSCFELGIASVRSGVISGVPLEMDMEPFRDLVGVEKVRRMSRFKDGRKELTQSVMLTFCGDLPERIYVDYITYRVRPFESGPLRCFCCQEYGHAAAVCRGVKKCGRCGVVGCDSSCEQEKEPECIHCKGKHHTGALECPRRKKETNVKRIREKRGISYAEAVRRTEGKESEERRVVGEVAEQREERRNATEVISVDKKCFLAFIAMVINCAVEITGKSERIKMILDAARRFLKVDDVSGEDLDNVLREGFTPTPGPE